MHQHKHNKPKSDQAFRLLWGKKKGLENAFILGTQDTLTCKLSLSSYVCISLTLWVFLQHLPTINIFTTHLIIFTKFITVLHHSMSTLSFTIFFLLFYPKIPSSIGRTVTTLWFTTEGATFVSGCTRQADFCLRGRLNSRFRGS